MNIIAALAGQLPLPVQQRKGLTVQPLSLIAKPVGAKILIGSEAA